MEKDAGYLLLLILCFHYSTIIKGEWNRCPSWKEIQSFSNNMHAYYERMEYKFNIDAQLVTAQYLLKCL